MRILIVVVSPDEAICRVVEHRQGQLIPGAYRQPKHRIFGQATFQLIACRATLPIKIESLLDRIEALADVSTKGVVIVADRRYGLAQPPLSDIYFVNEFDQHGALRSTQNFLSLIFNRVLRDFGYLLAQFSNKKFEKILRLPVRNFVAKEIREMRLICQQTTDVQGFSYRLDGVLNKLRKRQHPNRKSDYDDVYVVDDKDKHFRLGLEDHARADTGTPHIRLCRLSNAYRFGCGFTSNQHYNVSMEKGHMTDSYPNCHGEYRLGENQTHLNMFTNDFF